MAALTKSQIFAVNDLTAGMEKVDVPEWGGHVYVRVMTGAEKDAFEGRYATARYDNLRAVVAVSCVCDETGKSIFSGDDVKALGEKSQLALDRVLEAAKRVNHLTKDEVDSLRKNSEASPSEDSPSD